MAILAGTHTRTIVQGITGFQGIWTAGLIKAVGPGLVAGVTPGKGGQEVQGVPVYDTVAEAVKNHPGLNSTLILVPGRLVFEAAWEALEAGLKLVVISSAGVPPHDVMRLAWQARFKGAKVLGPEALGVLSPGVAQVGSQPGGFFQPGKVGILSKGGTATLDLGKMMAAEGLGVSTVVNLGGCRLRCTGMTEVLAEFEQDPDTEAVVLIGEIGGNEEGRLAAWYAKHGRKPIIALLLGKTNMEGHPMGHPGAVAEGGRGSWPVKAADLQSAGINVAESPAVVLEFLKNVLSPGQNTQMPV